VRRWFFAAAATNLHGLSYLPDVWGLHPKDWPAHPAGLAHDAYLPVEGWMEHAAFDIPALRRFTNFSADWR